MGNLLSDIRFAGRSLLRRPGFSLISILVLSIGIGAVAVMFSTLNATLLRPLPFPDPDRLVWCWSTNPSRNANSVAAMDYFDFRERNDVFSSLAARLLGTPGRIVTGESEPERVRTSVVSANFFETLGAHPLHGRSFVSEEEIEGGPHAVVLSYSYWQRRFGGEADVAGRVLTIDGEAFEIVGVMPEHFAYPEDADLWVPMRRNGRRESPRGNRNFSVIGRLREGITIEQAQAQMEIIARKLEEENPDVNHGWSVRLEALHERFVGHLRAAMWILMGAVTLLLLTACANLSSLFLAKVTARSNELAVRFSLGASRWAVARQMLTESLLISLLGTLAGIALAFLGTHLVKTIGSADIRRLDEIGIDSAVLLFSAALSVATGVLFGIMPALKSTRTDLVQSLKEGAQSTETRSSLRTRSVLVVAQIALCLVLLVGSGLLVKSLYRLQQVNPGFNPQAVLTMEVQLPADRYNEPLKQEQFFSEVLDRIRALPGVIDASAVSQFPLMGGPWNYIHPADRPPRDPSERLSATRRRAMEGYFRTLQIPLTAGRTFEPSDRFDSRPVVVVSQTLADQFFPGENPIGRELIHPWDENIYLEIIGVVGDLKDYGLASDSRPIFYLAFRQATARTMNLAIRFEGEPFMVAPAVRNVVRSLDKNVPLYNIGSLEKRISESTASQKFQTLLLGTFAAIALILTAIGLYGVLAYFVSQRRRELGIRIALGASGSSVMVEVVRKGLMMAAAGVGLGLLGGLVATRLLRSLLFETTSTDWLTYIVMSTFLILVALVACALPAIKAVRIDPVKALKME